MFIIDFLLKVDLEYKKILFCFKENLEEFEKVFVKVWFKLIYWDMGLKVCYIVVDLLLEQFIWQDLIFEFDYGLIGGWDIKKIKKQILEFGLMVVELVCIVWVFVVSFCGIDMWGGVNGVCIWFEFQKNWVVNNFEEVVKVFVELDCICIDFNEVKWGDIEVFMVDMIVLGGVVVIEKVVKDVGYDDIEVFFVFGCVDVVQE